MNRSPKQMAVGGTVPVGSWILLLSVISLGTGAWSQENPKVEDYATIESITNGVPVWSFSNLTYIYGVSPDFMPGVVMQVGNRHPIVKIQPKKSWEIKSNYAGAESEMTRRSAYNDSQPMLPIHLIDGDPSTAWTSLEMTGPNSRPEWIRIDLPVEAEIASLVLKSADYHPSYGTYGKALPKELEIKTSCDASKWETVYTNKRLAQTSSLEIKFKPRRAKQIWIIGNNLREVPSSQLGRGRYAFSVGEVEVRDTSGANLALISRGASVTVSSTSYVMLNDRFTQDALWNSLNYDLGNKWVRIGGDNGSFMWHYVEHEKGKLEIDPVADQSVTELVQHGVNVILNLDWKGNWIYMNPPRKTDWLKARFRQINDAYNDPVGPADANPEMYQGYLRYIEYMVRHFKDRVTYFELGNEWNENPWNRLTPEHYMNTFFEPAFQIVKKVAPEAKVMLGSTVYFGPADLADILDCLGAERRTGIQSGKLHMVPGAFAIRDYVHAKDLTVSVEAQNEGRTGLVLRYKDRGNYLMPLYSASEHSMMLFEVLNGDRGKPRAIKKVPDLGPIVKLEAKVRGALTTLTISNGRQTISTTATVQKLQDTGAVGLTYQAGERAQYFANFAAVDSEHKVLARDDFRGPDGTVPMEWKYIRLGPNPIPQGIAPKIDAIAWHPVVEPDAKYFAAVRELQSQSRALGFKGRFFATEIYAGSMYPPGEKVPYDPFRASETQMAKYLAKSLVGHSGLGMEAGPCHPHFTAYAHPQALCQTTWGMQTLNPCRPTMSYYLWRTLATVTDDFHPADFPVKFSKEKGLLFFTFERNERERMVGAWLDGPERDGIAEAKTDLTFPGIRAKQAKVVDIMNGTEQPLDFVVNGSDTVIKGMLIKDYPVFVRLIL